MNALFVSLREEVSMNRSSISRYLVIIAALLVMVAPLANAGMERQASRDLRGLQERSVLGGLTVGDSPQVETTPTLVSYQGQVTVNGTPHNGSGYFKFAVVNAAGTTSYWSNDNTSINGGEPTANVPLSVSGGLFNVLLGDTSLSGMTSALTAPVFSGSDRYLRVWFATAPGGPYTQLSPDRRIGSTPYALNAETLDGQDSSAFSLTSHNHFGQTWSGNTTTGLTLNNSGTVGLRATGSYTGVLGTVNATVAGSYHGVYGNVTGGPGANVLTYGVYGESSYAGVKGRAVSSFSSDVGVIGESDDFGVQGYGVFGVYGESNSTLTLGRGVYGTATSSAGQTRYGVQGNASGAGTDYGVYATSDDTGVYGVSTGTSGYGVYGEATASNGYAGVYGRSASTPGYGVYGFATATSGVTFGVYGQSNSPDGRGVRGEATAGSGSNYGVYGSSNSTSGYGVYGTSYGTGVYGQSTATSGPPYGVYGVANAVSGTGVYGSGGVVGVYGYSPAASGATFGVRGISDSTAGTGVFGQGDTGVSGYGQSTSGATGVSGSAFATAGTNYAVYGFASNSGANDYGMYGTGDDTGVYGSAFSTSGTDYGVYGLSDDTGVYGVSTGTSGSTYGLYGETTSTLGVNYGVFGSGHNYGVYGTSTLTGLYGNTDSTTLDWGMYTPDDIFVGGACSGCVLDFAARNGGGEALEPGDLVAVVGVEAPLGESRQPLMVVRKAVAGDAVVGVVYRAARLEVPEDGGEGTTATASLRYAEGAAAPGELLVVVTHGPTYVKVSGPVAVNDLLVASAEPGRAQVAHPASMEDVIGMLGKVLGKVLGPPDPATGLAAVLVALQ
jgi:hypothetical protein